MVTGTYKPTDFEGQYAVLTNKGLKLIMKDVYISGEYVQFCIQTSTGGTLFFTPSLMINLETGVEFKF
jgi:hypothetical protein